MNIRMLRKVYILWWNRANVLYLQGSEGGNGGRKKTGPRSTKWYCGQSKKYMEYYDEEDFSDDIVEHWEDIYT